jgi:hypothetical protein
MPLSESQKQTIIAHVESRMPACPMCGGTEWYIADEAGHLENIDLGQRQPGPGRGMPVIVVACDNCYCVYLFSAVGLGLID